MPKSCKGIPLHLQSTHCGRLGLGKAMHSHQPFSDLRSNYSTNNENWRKKMGLSLMMGVCFGVKKIGTFCLIWWMREAKGLRKGKGERERESGWVGWAVSSKLRRGASEWWSLSLKGRFLLKIGGSSKRKREKSHNKGKWKALDKW